VAPATTTTIDDVLEAFLADQGERLLARTMRSYEDVIGLLRHCLNGYGPNTPQALGGGVRGRRGGVLPSVRA
jgi:hypothetical protein